MRSSANCAEAGWVAVVVELGDDPGDGDGGARKLTRGTRPPGAPRRRPNPHAWISETSRRIRRLHAHAHRPDGAASPAGSSRAWSAWSKMSTTVLRFRDLELNTATYQAGVGGQPTRPHLHGVRTAALLRREPEPGVEPGTDPARRSGATTTSEAPAPSTSTSADSAPSSAKSARPGSSRSDPSATASADPAYGLTRLIRPRRRELRHIGDDATPPRPSGRYRLIAQAHTSPRSPEFPASPGCHVEFGVADDGCPPWMESRVRPDRRALLTSGRRRDRIEELIQSKLSELHVEVLGDFDEPSPGEHRIRSRSRRSVSSVQG